LCREGGAVGGSRGSAVCAVGLLEARFDSVGEVGGQDFVVDAGLDYGIFDREDDFAALEKIAGHPVGGAQIYFVFAAVGKVEDAGVLEEATYDGADANAAGKTFDTGAKNAEAADDEVDFDSGVGSVV
jgi:hypothetical protein